MYFTALRAVGRDADSDGLRHIYKEELLGIDFRSRHLICDRSRVITPGERSIPVSLRPVKAVVGRYPR